MAEPTEHRDTLVPRNKYVLSIAIFAFALGVLEFTRILVLPYAQWLSDLSAPVISSAGILTLMATSGYTGLFVLMALESASLPIPSELVLPLAGYLVSIHVMNLWVAIGVSTVAGIVGALFDYALALWLGRPFVLKILKTSGLNEDSLDRAEAWFERSGEWTVFAARFVPGLRSSISLPAGLFRMGIKSFALLTVAGCFMWSAILIYAGDLAGSANAFQSSSTVAVIVSGLVAVLSAAYIAYYVLQGRGRAESSPGA